MVDGLALRGGVSPEGIMASLPLLDAVSSWSFDLPNEPLYLVGIQHLVESTADLLEVLQRKLHLNGTWLGGKPYSASPPVVSRIRSVGCWVTAGPASWQCGQLERSLEEIAAKVWSRAAADLSSAPPGTVIILDDGAKMLSTLPQKVSERHRCVGVEQTTNGLLRRTSRCPIVAVASSAAKRFVEPVLIAERVVSHLLHSTPQVARRFGVVGLGAVGTSVHEELSRSFNVACYDADPSRRSAVAGTWVEDLRELIMSADVVVGCTGQDVIPASAIDGKGPLWLASASSSDVEFRSILSLVPGGSLSVGSTVRADIRSRQVHVLNGGAPINFTRALVSVPSDLIQLTRSLLYVGVLQALTLPVDAPATHAMLHPSYQERIVKLWFDMCAETSPLVGQACKRWRSDHRWIAQHSGGELLDSATPE